jgi:hypothetical protein
MYGLNHRNVFRPGGVIAGRGDQRKCVVEMDDLRPVTLE